MKKMRRSITVLVVSTVLILISVVTVHAGTAAISSYRDMVFENGDVKIYARAHDVGKTITITAELWRGTTHTGTWYDSGTSLAEISGVKIAQSGATYTLKVSYTVNGTEYHLPDLIRVAP